MAETKQQHWLRRGLELNKLRKHELVALYKKMGGLGGTHPPEKWYKEELISSVTEMEWTRLPEDQKLPDPPRLCPPCDHCGKGQYAKAHQYGQGHNYRYTQDADAPWVPESEAEEKRLAALAMKELDQEETEEQPPAADATARPTLRLVHTRDSGAIPPQLPCHSGSGGSPLLAPYIPPAP